MCVLTVSAHFESPEGRLISTLKPYNHITLPHVKSSAIRCNFYDHSRLSYSVPEVHLEHSRN